MVMSFRNYCRPSKIVKAISLFFCFFSLSLFAQDEVADSLKQAYKTAKHDSTRCMALNDLGEYVFNQTPDSSIVMWQKVVKIATENLKKNKDKNNHFTFSFLLARAYLNHGFYYQSKTGPDDALKYFKKSLDINTEINEKEGMGNCLVDMGLIYFRKGDVLQALNNYHKGLKIYEKIKSPNSMAYCLGNIGNLYAAQDDLENALNYLNRSAKIYEEQDNSVGLAFALSGIASIYSEKTDPECKLSADECSKQSKEKALKTYLKVLGLWADDNNQTGVASVSLNISSLYRKQGDLVKALDYATRGLSLYESLENKLGISTSNNMLANIMFDKGNISSAERYANASMNIAKGLGYPKMLMSVSAILKKIYEKQNNYKGALEMEELSVKMRDSLNNETTRKSSIKKQFELEYEMQAEKDSILNAAKIEKEQLKYDQAITQQRLYTLGGVFGFVFMLIVAIVSFRAFRTKQRANTIITQQSAKIEMANKDLERQHLLNQKIFSVISHDFRGPILSLNLVLSRFKDNSADEKLNKYLKDIDTSVHNANTVLNNLLNWAKAEINIEAYDGSTCMISEIVVKIKNEFKEKLEDKKLELIEQIPESAEFSIPSDILTIALRNLVSNAIKFSRPDNTIKISFDMNNKTLKIKDQGIGISQEKLNSLFKQQVNSDAGTQKEQGFGMGLYIVSELLYKYNYTIIADSKIGEGTIFTIFEKK